MNFCCILSSLIGYVQKLIKARSTSQDKHSTESHHRTAQMDHRKIVSPKLCEWRDTSWDCSGLYQSLPGSVLVITTECNKNSHFFFSFQNTWLFLPQANGQRKVEISNDIYFQLRFSSLTGSLGKIFADGPSICAVCSTPPPKHIQHLLYHCLGALQLCLKGGSKTWTLICTQRQNTPA